jgi:hypothetical protein
MGTSENTPLAELAEIPALSTEFSKKSSELYVLLACDILLYVKSATLCQSYPSASPMAPAA